MMCFCRNCIRLRLKQRKFLHKCRIRCLSQLPPASNSLSHSAFRSSFRSSSHSYPHWFHRLSQLILQRIPTRSAAHPELVPPPPFPRLPSGVPSWPASDSMLMEQSLVLPKAAMAIRAQNNSICVTFESIR